MKRMTSMTARPSQADSEMAGGRPGWRPLTALGALVVLAHVWVLQGAPAHLGIGTNADAAVAKTLITRSIETKAEPRLEATAASPLAAKPVKAVPNTPKKASNSAVAPVNNDLAAPELIVKAVSPPATELPTKPTASASATEATPTASATALATPLATAPTTSPPALAAALPAGPKTTPVTAISLPGSVRLLYQVVGLSKTLNYQAKAELAWKSNGDNYEAMMKVSAFLIGSRSMSSVGKITGSGLAPTRFADKFKSELAAHFEPEKGKISFSANTPDAPWMEGAQDRVSVFFQLGGMLAANPAGFPAGSNVTFLTIGPREADTWTFVIEAQDSLELMGATMPTLKLTRKPRKEFDQKVEIWYAPSLGYLPVRNRITQQNGDFLDQQLTQVMQGS